MADDNPSQAATAELLDRLAAIENLIQVKIVKPEEAATRAMVEKVTSAIEAALAEHNGLADIQQSLAALSRRISTQSQVSDTPVTPRDAYATLVTLQRMGFTIIAPHTES